MKFGNWNVTAAAIEWSGEGFQRFEIDKTTLLETIQSEDSAVLLYKWILLATQEEWLENDDLYDLNFAFVFAAAGTPQYFSYEIFDNTLEYQFDFLDEEEENEMNE